MRGRESQRRRPNPTPKAKLELVLELPLLLGQLLQQEQRQLKLQSKHLQEISAVITPALPLIRLPWVLLV